MKIALGIEYCGTPYCGWQYQNTQNNSIQEYVEKALSKIADRKIKLYCAGRTDARVHALHQVVHFETDVSRQMYSWVIGGNTSLPDTISILWAKQISDDFHARFSAITRKYRYIILNRRSRPAAYCNLVTWVHQPLDETRMQLAAESLLGKHDFTSFQSTACQAKSPIRNVSSVNLYRVNDFIVFEIEANAFLHRMVRNIVGVLIKIGSHEADTSWLVEVLAEKDRIKAAKTAAPDGLYLVAVQYPEIYGIPRPVSSQCWL